MTLSNSSRTSREYWCEEPDRGVEERRQRLRMPTFSRPAALTTKEVAQGAAVSTSFRLKGHCFCTVTQTVRGRGRRGGDQAWVLSLQHSPCPEARSALRSATPAASEPRPPHEQGPGPPSFPEMDAEMDQGHCGRFYFP